MLHKKPGLLFIFIIMLACGWSSISVAKSSDSKVLRMATTTSTENSGLLRYLLPYFTKDTGYDVHVIAVGTGKALRMGQEPRPGSLPPDMAKSVIPSCTTTS